MHETLKLTILFSTFYVVSFTVFQIGKKSRFFFPKQARFLVLPELLFRRENWYVCSSGKRDFFLDFPTPFSKNLQYPIEERSKRYEISLKACILCYQLDKEALNNSLTLLYFFLFQYARKSKSCRCRFKSGK